MISLTDSVLVVFIAFLLCYSFYDEFGIDMLKGKTLLKVKLNCENRIDCLIFIGLIGILIYHNIAIKGKALTTYLLISLVLITIYISYIRCSKLFFKVQGFFYSNIFTPYHCIEAINLSQDGVLVIKVHKRQLMIKVAQLEDLEKIYHVLERN